MIVQGLALFFLLIVPAAQAEQMPFSGTSKITDDFGLRMKPLRGGTTNHTGIDIKPSTGKVFGAAISAISDGTIKTIARDAGNRWYITVSATLGDSKTHEVNYVHIFTNGDVDVKKPKKVLVDGIFELRKSTETKIPYIVRRASGTTPAAAYAAQIFQVPDYPNLFTTNSIAAGDLIAPVGYSGLKGSSDAHLHLAIDTPGYSALPTAQRPKRALNPLFFLPTQSSIVAKNNSGVAATYPVDPSQFKIAIKRPKICQTTLGPSNVSYMVAPDSSVYTHIDFGAPITVTIDSRSGLDLNFVDFEIDGFVMGQYDVAGAPELRGTPGSFGTHDMSMIPRLQYAGLDDFVQDGQTWDIPGQISGTVQFSVYIENAKGTSKTQPCSITLKPRPLNTDGSNTVFPPMYVFSDFGNIFSLNQFAVPASAPILYA